MLGVSQHLMDALGVRLGEQSRLEEGSRRKRGVASRDPGGLIRDYVRWK